MSSWQENIEINANNVTIADVENLIFEMEESKDKFLQKQASKLYRYLTQYSNESITKAELEYFIMDIRDLIELNSLKERIEDKVLSQKIIQIMSVLLLKGVVSLSTKII